MKGFEQFGGGQLYLLDAEGDELARVPLHVTTKKGNVRQCFPVHRPEAKKSGRITNARMILLGSEEHSCTVGRFGKGADFEMTITKVDRGDFIEITQLSLHYS